jgi:hypothetical protein
MRRHRIDVAPIEIYGQRIRLLAPIRELATHLNIPGRVGGIARTHSYRVHLGLRSVIIKMLHGCAGSHLAQGRVRLTARASSVGLWGRPRISIRERITLVTAPVLALWIQSSCSDHKINGLAAPSVRSETETSTVSMRRPAWAPAARRHSVAERGEGRLS